MTGSSGGLSAAGAIEDDEREVDLDFLISGAAAAGAIEDDGREVDLDFLTAGAAAGGSVDDPQPEDMGITGFAIDRLHFFAQQFKVIDR